MINNRTTYAIRALCELAHAEDHFSTAEAIAKAQGIPKKFLPQILGDLTRGGLVRSIRGFGGGARLSRAPEQIKLLEIIELMQNNIFILGYHLDPRNETDSKLGGMYKKVEKAMKAEFGRVTLADLKLKSKGKRKRTR